jgi:hypothetical protein
MATDKPRDPKATDASTAADGRHRESLEETLKTTQRLRSNYSKLNSELQNNSEIIKKVYSQQDVLIQRLSEEVEASGQVTAAHIATADALGITLEAGQKYLEILPLLTRAQQDNGQAMQDAVGDSQDLADQFLGLHGFGKDMIAQQQKMSSTFQLTGRRIKEMGIGSFLASKMQGILAGMSMKAVEAVAALGASIITTAFALDKATSEFKKQTGILDQEYTKAIVGTYEEFRMYGVTIDNSANSQRALTQTFTDYTMLSKAERATIMKTTAVYEAQGIAAESTAEAFQTATKYLGESAKAADESVREMVAFSRELGVAPEKMLKDFAAAGPQLAKFGNQAEKAFKELAVQSKETGMAVERMLDIVAQFDTFEGAAEATGKLNAMLGGPFLGTMEMIATTNPAERFEKLRGALTDAGKDFETMGYYEKQAIANAMGLKDVGELALVMRDRTDLLAGATEKTAEEIEKEAEKAAQMQDVMTQLKDIFLSLAPVIISILEPFKWLAEKFRENPKLAKAFGYVLLTYFSARALAPVVGGIKSFGGALMKSKKGIDAVKGSTMGLQGTLKNMKMILYIGAFALLLGAIANLLDPAKGGGAGNIMALGLALAVLMGVLVGVAALLMNPALEAAFIVVIGGFVAMSVAVALVTAAVAALAGAISLLPDNVLTSLFGGEAPGAGDTTMITMDEGNFQGVTDLSKINFEELGAGLDSIVDPMNRVAEASNKLNTAGLQALGDIPKNIQALTEDKVKNFVAVLEMGAKLNQPADDTLLATLKELVAEIQGSGKATAAAIKDKKFELPDIIFNTDERGFTDLVKDILWGEWKPS